MALYDEEVNMGKTVAGALNEFMQNFVNLNPSRMKIAKTSMENLFENISSPDDVFFDVYVEKNIQFGSFARKTKIQPIDDIDIMICLKADGSTYSDNNGVIEITVNNYNSVQNNCCFNENQLNSTKVINQFIKKLKTFSDYKKAELHKKGESATLQLASYEWNFDIVPCFFTVPENNGRTYYIIPDGNGYWKKTDPRIDRDIIFDLDKRLGGFVLDPIRLIKYWNRRPTMPSMPSYTLESLLVQYFQAQKKIASTDLCCHFRDCLAYIYKNVYNEIIDLKGIQGDLNKLEKIERDKIANRAFEDCNKINKIIKNPDLCFPLLIEIFGKEFPCKD